MNSPMRAALVAATVVALAGATTACGAASADTADGINGEVLWYSSHNPTQNEALVAAFNEEYPGVDVQVLRLVTGELATRYAQERDSGQNTADVVTLSDPAFVEMGAENEWWMTDVEVAGGWPSDALVDGVANTGYLPLLLAYNTDQLSDGEAPESWEDLVDPRFEGALMMPDIRNDPAYLSLAQIWSEEYGDDFLEALAAQEPRLVASVVPGNEALASGSAAVLAPNARPAATSVIDAGAPIELVQPEPTTAIEYYSMIASESPNPEAAAEFFKFLSTKQGQEAFNGVVGSSPRADTEGTVALPTELVPLRDVLPAATERRAELLSLLGIE